MRASLRACLIVAVSSLAILLASAAQGSQIQGRIADAQGVPAAGVTVAFTGGLPSAVTNSLGNYSVLVPGGAGKFTVTPWKAGCFFTPATATVSVSGSNATANFVAAQARVSLLGSPAVVLNSINGVPPAPTGVPVALGAPVTVTWQLFGFTPSAFNYIEWVTDADPFTIHTVKNTQKVVSGGQTTYWGWFSAPSTNCTVTLRIHVVYGSNVAIFSTNAMVKDGTVTPKMPTVAIEIPPTPTGADPGTTITVGWSVNAGKPPTTGSASVDLNRIRFSESLTDANLVTLPYSTSPNVLTPNTVTVEVDGTTTYHYLTQIKVPNFTGKLYIQAHSLIDGNDYFSLVVPISVPNPNNPLVFVDPHGDPTNTSIVDPPPADGPWQLFDATGKLTVTFHVLLNPASLPAPYNGYPVTQFDSDNSTALVSLGVRTAIEPAGDAPLQWQNPNKANAQASWSFGNVGRPSTSALLTGNAHYNAASGFFEVNAVFTKMPTHNSGFGKHTLFAQIVDIKNGKVVSAPTIPFGAPPAATTLVAYFYGRHDLCSPNPTVQNWFYYWKDGNVVSMPSSVKYSALLATNKPVSGQPPITDVPGYYDPFGQIKGQMPDPGHIYITPNAAEQNFGPVDFFTKGGQKTTAAGHGTGPQCCAETIAHYLEIKFYHDNFPVPAADQSSPYGDPDSDGVPNFVETWRMGVGTDPNNPDTFGVATINAAWSSNGDAVLRALRKELTPGISVNPAADWSWPWRSFNGNSPPNATVPTVSVIADQPNADEQGPVDGDFMITRDITTNALQVQFSFPAGKGFAVNGKDYQKITGSVNMPAGVATVFIPVRILPRNGLGDGPATDPSIIDPTNLTSTWLIELDLLNSPAGAYIIDPVNNKATVTLLDKI